MHGGHSRADRWETRKLGSVLECQRSPRPLHDRRGREGLIIFKKKNLNSQAYSSLPAALSFGSAPLYIYPPPSRHTIGGAHQAGDDPGGAHVREHGHRAGLHRARAGLQVRADYARDDERRAPNDAARAWGRGERQPDDPSPPSHAHTRTSEFNGALVSKHSKRRLQIDANWTASANSPGLRSPGLPPLDVFRRWC